MNNYEMKTDENGTKRYYLNGNLHREDGPAVELANGYKEWRKNDFLHREGGPAIECSDGSKKWYKNGLLHREDGPAVEYATGDNSWWLNNNCYGHNNDFTNESWIKFVKTLIFS